ncbi:MAG: hypothetical protein ACERKD_21690 [Prolixibacteraceae bacterium]
MSLKKTLQKQNYDLIEGPKRNQDLLQLWIKRDLDRIALYDPSIRNVFGQDFSAAPFESTALSINSSDKEEFDFSAGMDFVKNALLQFKIANANIDAHIKGGKSVTVSYNNSYTKEIGQFELEKYLFSIDSHSLIPSLIRELNRNNLFVIAGVVFAKNLNFVIESDRTIDTTTEASLNKIAEGKVNFEKTADHQITLTSDTEKAFPIAVKAYRIRFVKGKFNKLILATDKRDFFK